MNFARLALSLLAISVLAACASVPAQDAQSAHAAAEKQAPTVKTEQRAQAPAGTTASPAAAQTQTGTASPAQDAAAQTPTGAPPPVQDAAAQNAAAKPPLHLAASTAIPPPPSNLWQRIRTGFGLPEMNSPLVRKNEQWYARHPDYVRRMMRRSGRYLYYVVQKVEERGMPTEIALLPMVESAYNPDAYSRSHAAGLWQFTASTGRHYGLKQNWWYDGRRDVRAATTAALNYLENLYNMFGNWDIALAAYNWGEGAVARAIAHNKARGKPTDYQSLRLPAETRNYVPRLLAIKHIVMDPGAFGIALAPIPNHPYFTTVTTRRSMDVKQAAHLATMPLSEFVSLNPAYKQLVLTHGRSATLLLPLDKADIFSANLERYHEPLLSWRSYTPRRRERLDGIARRFGISTSRLRKINGISSRRRMVARGNTLLVPRRERFVGRSGGATRELAHIVKRGDTLYVLARRHGVSVAQIKRWNRLRSSRLVPGQRLILRVAAGGQPGTRVATGHRVHIVRRGDSLYVLARRNGVSVAQIKRWNGLTSNRLVPGQRLILRVAAGGSHGTQVATRNRTGRRTLYTVRSGDTLHSIARRFNVAVNDIQRWNNLPDGHTLHPGETVAVYPQS